MFSVPLNRSRCMGDKFRGLEIRRGQLLALEAGRLQSASNAAITLMFRSEGLLRR
jgi:hypothetical protein